MDAESCTHYHECTSDSGYGCGAYEDLLNNAMGGRPWQECHCLSQDQCAALAGKQGDESEGERMKRAYGLPGKERE